MIAVKKQLCFIVVCKIRIKESENQLILPYSILARNMNL